jgi:hypothetical protein
MFFLLFFNRFAKAICSKLSACSGVRSFVSSILVPFLTIRALDQALGNIVARVMGELADCGEMEEVGVEFERGVV